MMSILTKIIGTCNRCKGFSLYDTLYGLYFVIKSRHWFTFNKSRKVHVKNLSHVPLVMYFDVFLKTFFQKFELPISGVAYLPVFMVGPLIRSSVNSGYQAFPVWIIPNYKITEILCMLWLTVYCTSKHIQFEISSNICSTVWN